MTAIFDEIARNKMLQSMYFQDFTYDGTPISEMQVRQIECKIAREYIASFHYSHTMPDSTRFAFAGYLNGKICGVVCYGMGCNKNQYTAIIPDIQNGQYLELTRLWCAKDYPKNTESKIISESLKMLPSEILLVVSFADEAQGHCGIIYQATNWYYLGKSNGGKMLIGKNGIEKHPRLIGIYRMRHPEYKKYTNKQIMDLLGYEYVISGRKHRYVYLRGTKKQKKKMFSQIKDRLLPYPKSEKKKNMLNEEEMISAVD